MTGITLGGWLITRRLSKIRNNLFSFIKIELMICAFCLMAGPLLLYLGHLSSLKLSFIFFILSALSGFLVGLEFPLANKIYGQDKVYTKTGGLLYALDLIGAWLAALIVSVALVPVVGILKTCVLLLVLKAISLLLVSSSKL
jgi:spermidine synthase